jgi:hypothetical protein
MLPLLVATLLTGFAFQQRTPPEGPPAQTASIRGRIVDKVTGAPLVRAVVIVRRSRTNQATQSSTDADGRRRVERTVRSGSNGSRLATTLSSRYPPRISRGSRVRRGIETTCDHAWRRLPSGSPSSTAIGGRSISGWLRFLRRGSDDDASYRPDQT